MNRLPAESVNKKNNLHNAVLNDSRTNIILVPKCKFQK